MYQQLRLFFFFFGMSICKQCLRGDIYITCRTDQYCKAGHCVECVEDINCPANKSVCIGSKCEECFFDSDCDPGCGQKCNSKKCKHGVTCPQGEMCSRSNPKTCVECEGSNDCPALKPVCSNDKCIECEKRSDCQTDSTCDSSCSSNTCSNATLDCTQNQIEKYCTSVGACAECALDTHCPIEKPFCYSYNNTCVECLEHANCRSESDCNATCTNQVCIPGGKTCRGEGGVCEKEQGVCVECLQASNCPASFPICHNTRICIKCSEDADCRSNTNCNATCAQGISLKDNLCPLSASPKLNCQSNIDLPYCKTTGGICVECMARECGKSKECVKNRCQSINSAHAFSLTNHLIYIGLYTALVILCDVFEKY